MKTLLLGVLLILTSATHAATNAEVIKWTKQTLLNTFSIDYHYTSEDATVHSKRFTPSAWEALRNFLGDYVQVIRDKKLTIHPTFLLEPNIIDSGVASGISYWRVNEELLFPEIHIKVAFSLIIIATSQEETSPFIVQSMNMVKQESP